MYVEPNGKQLPRDPWSFRQTGVYHKFTATTKRSWIVLLHPNDHAIAQSRLEKCIDATRETTLAKHPLNVHLVVISSYLIHWQAHTESLASELEHIVRLKFLVFCGPPLIECRGDILTSLTRQDQKPYQTSVQIVYKHSAT